ncbi:MAG: FecR family protein [Bacteroidota bacterium]
MKTDSKYRDKEEVIVRYLCNELNNAERQEFEKWINENPDNKNLFEDFKKLWSHSNNLSLVETTDIDADWQKTKQRMNFEQEAPTCSLPFNKNRFSFIRIAATIIILIGIGLLSKQFLFNSPELIMAESGEFKKEITLPDGSFILLNKHSQLTFPEKFKRKERLVSLSGEAFFEVVKNPEKKFKIDIDKNAIVEVLGTSFNINSTKTDGTVNVNVVSGKVAFYKPEDAGAKTILIKDENAMLKNGVITKNLPKDKNFMSWRTGVLRFEDEKIEKVCKALSKFYNREIDTEGLENTEIRLTSTFDNQTLESVLDEIKLVLGLEHIIKEKKIIIHKPEELFK